MNARLARLMGQETAAAGPAAPGPTDAAHVVDRRKSMRALETAHLHNQELRAAVGARAAESEPAVPPVLPPSSSPANGNGDASALSDLERRIAGLTSAAVPAAAPSSSPTPSAVPNAGSRGPDVDSIEAR